MTVCQLHFVLRMIQEQFRLPRDVVREIAKRISIPCRIMVWKKTGYSFITAYDVWFSDKEAIAQFQINPEWFNGNEK